MKLGELRIGGEVFRRAKGTIKWIDDEPRWLLNLDIVADCKPDDEEPAVRLYRLPFDVADWKTLCGTKIAVRDPVEEDPWDQNFFSGPHFENLVDLTIELGAPRGKSMVVTLTGKSVMTNDLLWVQAKCEIWQRPKPVPTATPPLGRKECNKCRAVSFDEVMLCPRCGAAGWWNE